MSSYVVFSLIAAVGFAISGIINKLASKYAITERWPLLFWYSITFIPFALLIPILVPITVPATLNQWGEIFILSLFSFLGDICFFAAIFKLDASVFSPFLQLQSAFLILLAYFFLGERFPATSYLWMGILIIGAVLVSIGERMSVRTFFQKPILLIIGLQLFHSVSSLFAGFVLRFTNFWNLIFWSSAINIILVLVFVAANGLRVRISWKQLQPLVVTNAILFISVLSLFRAFEENVSISGVLSLLTGPITFLIAVVASKVKPNLLEHHTAKVYAVRGAGVLLTFVGAIMLST